MRLNPEDLTVESYTTTPIPSTSTEGVTLASCNLSDDDFTCGDTCSSRPPGLTCYVSCDCESQ